MDERTQDWLNDGGFQSRKLWFCVLGLALVLVGALIAAHWPAFGANYETFVGGIVGITSLFLTGNVAARWVAAKHVIAKTLGVKDKDDKGDADDKPDDKADEAKPPVEPEPQD